MKLCKYNNYDLTTQKITGTEKAAFCFFDLANIPADYSNINTIENLNLYGFNACDSFDYKRVRDLIKTEVEAVGWSALSSNEKITAATHKIGTNPERAAAFNNDFDLMDSAGAEYHANVLKVRSNRMQIVKSKIHNRLGHIMYGPYNAPEIILSEITETVLLMYENEGLGGVCDGDNAEGLLDYINETAGTSYELGAGLRSKPWTPYGFADMSVFCDTLLNILQKGIF
jgi:hypothetical protein